MYNIMRNKIVIYNESYYQHPEYKNYAGSKNGRIIDIISQEYVKVKHCSHKTTLVNLSQDGKKMC